MQHGDSSCKNDSPCKARLNFIGEGSLVEISRTGGGMGHNGIPLQGWHFHYACFSAVAQAVKATFESTGSEQ